MLHLSDKFPPNQSPVMKCADMNMLVEGPLFLM